MINGSKKQLDITNRSKIYCESIHAHNIYIQNTGHTICTGYNKEVLLHQGLWVSNC